MNRGSQVTYSVKFQLSSSSSQWLHSSWSNFQRSRNYFGVGSIVGDFLYFPESSNNSYYVSIKKQTEQNNEETANFMVCSVLIEIV